MRPKEIQEKLGIDAERIKFFKREGVFSPENPPLGNQSTNYTDSDFENLKKLVVLTKSGLTCSDIKKIQNGKLSLQEAIVSRTNIIKNDIARKQNALILLSEMLDDKVKFDTFETEHYWNIISSREAGGEEFVDIEDMYDYQSVSLIRDICCPNCGEENEVDLEDYMYDHSSYEKENGMGPDIVYSFDSEYNYCCLHCGASLQIEGWIREYPVGAYDSEEINICEIEKDE